MNCPHCGMPAWPVSAGWQCNSDTSLGVVQPTAACREIARLKAQRIKLAKIVRLLLESDREDEYQRHYDQGDDETTCETQSKALVANWVSRWLRNGPVTDSRKNEGKEKA